MNLEEELQQSIEKNVLEETEKHNIDVMAYSSVFIALSKAVEYEPPDDLANSVLKQLEARRKKTFILNDYFWLAAGIVALLAVGIYTSIQTSVTLDLGFLNKVLVYRGVFVFGVCFVALLNYLDRRLLRGSKQSII